MLEHIFVDMDGVLADTIGQIAKLNGLDPKDFEKRWAADNAGNYHPHHLLNTTHDELWDKIAAEGEAFWSTIEPYNHVQDLMWLVSEAVSERWDVLTSPQPNIGCYVGKIRWLKAQFGQLFTRMHLHSNKNLLAGRGRVLIDDFDQNCSKWVQAGGIAITFPQPWNRLHEIAANGEAAKIDYVASCLREVSRNQHSRLM